MHLVLDAVVMCHQMHAVNWLDCLKKNVVAIRPTTLYIATAGNEGMYADCLSTQEMYNSSIKENKYFMHNTENCTVVDSKEL
jgi:hypothetical protein